MLNCISTYFIFRKELKQEDERLDQMMEEERLRGLQMQAKKKELSQIKRCNYVKTLVHQIEENDSKKVNEQIMDLRVKSFHLSL